MEMLMGQRSQLSTEDEDVPKVPEELLPLVGGFLTRRFNEISLLRASVNKEDFATIQMIGHKLRGNSGSFGFAALGVLGADLEAAAIAQDHTETMKLIGNLELMVRRLQQNLA
jgi:HPt (histidine-containing phosphotransfer) domain-containing protein